ncbi:MAG: HAMP domain-containing sensor histidine kinase [Candidatus Gracilibacteria bacterium]
MNKNIQKTKKDLAIIFSVIVFIVVLVLGTVFFSAKYFREVSVEKKMFSSMVNDVERGRITINQIMNLSLKFDKDLFNNKRSKIPEPIEEFKPVGFINYILINHKSTIISSNIKDNIEEDFILEINNNDTFFETIYYGGFIIKKFLLNNNEGTFIIFKEIRYNFGDYITDLFGFLFVSLLFSLILYFIGLKFVNKAFIPVEENIADMKDFIHNAGHELKTPISVIDSNIQLIDDMKVYDAGMTKELKKEVLRLNTIIDGLIKLSNIDLLKDLQNNDLKDSIKDIIEEFKFKIIEKKIKINLSLPKNINIKANKDYFYIFLSNIIGNAIKYNNKKGTIDISYNNGRLIIKNSGIGINRKYLDKIFDRFFKADKSRNSEGFGIGLSLVKKISDIYKWSIKVDSNECKYTIFTIKF